MTRGCIYCELIGPERVDGFALCLHSDARGRTWTAAREDHAACGASGRWWRARAPLTVPAPDGMLSTREMWP